MTLKGTEQYEYALEQRVKELTENAERQEAAHDEIIRDIEQEVARLQAENTMLEAERDAAQEVGSEDRGLLEAEQLAHRETRDQWHRAVAHLEQEAARLRERVAELEAADSVALGG